MTDLMERVADALKEQMEAQADDDTPASMQRERGLIWLEGWFDLRAAITAMSSPDGLGDGLIVRMAKAIHRESGAEFDWGDIPEADEGFTRYAQAAWSAAASEILDLTALRTSQADERGKVVAGEGPQPIKAPSTLTCTGCKHLKTEWWKDYLENDETDSGTSAQCRGIPGGKFITAYWSDNHKAPEWCPFLATPPEPSVHTDCQHETISECFTGDGARVEVCLDCGKVLYIGTPPAPTGGQQ